MQSIAKRIAAGVFGVSIVVAGCAKDGGEKGTPKPTTGQAGRVALGERHATEVASPEHVRAGAEGGSEARGNGRRGSWRAGAATRSVGVSGTLARRKSEKLPQRNEFVDKLVMFDTTQAFNAGTMRRVALDASGATPRLVLNEPDNAVYPRAGEWVSDEQEAKFPFTELIPSWNVETPANTGVRIYLRAKDQGSGQWSPWLYLGTWGRVTPAGERVTKFDGGSVAVDCVELKQPATAWQAKVEFESFDTNVGVNPSVRRVAVVYSGKVEEAQQREELIGPREVPSNWAVDIPVPFRPQGDNPNVLRGQTCSPTSTSMVMAYWGVDKPTVENCLAIWDAENGLFGNWGRAVARAGETGLDAWITRYRNWDEVKAELASGQPVIASIRFAKGEYKSFIYDGSAGHLLVIRGLTPDGDPICNDPASRTFGRGVVYSADELGRAWFGNGGVAYVIKGKTPVAPAKASMRPTTRQTEKKVVLSVDGVD